MTADMLDVHLMVFVVSGRVQVVVGGWGWCFGGW